MSDLPAPITLNAMREKLYSAVVCDALDGLGYHDQSPRVSLNALLMDTVLVGRCRTTLWADLYHPDPSPYELELKAVDLCQRDDVLIAAAHGSMRSGIWGELLSTAARNRGCVGAIVDGAVRDITKMREMSFPVFARGTCIYDSRDRQRVTDIDVPVDIDGVTFRPGDLVIADRDGIVLVPREVEEEAIRNAWKKVHDENIVRDAIRGGMNAADAFDQYGIL
jgi:regulator of RNase E activity RraA